MKVSDTGPLIVLYETSFLWLLKELYEEILIPNSVRDELLIKPSGHEILKEDWIKTIELLKKDTVKILTTFIDQGEAEAITLAKENNCPVLLDEKKGRTIAKSLDMKIQGTLGCLILAKNRGLINSIKACIHKFLIKGYYIDHELIDEILKTVGEE